MKITINIQKQLPGSWDDVTFGQGLKLMKCKDTADTLAVFLDVKAETIKTAKIVNLEEVIKRIAFLETKMPEIMPKSINGYLLPKNLEFNSICRFEDVKSLVQKVLPAKEGDPLTPEQLQNYADIVGIYTMPNYENASQPERDQFAKQFFNSSCGEVMAIGNFTLVRFFELKIPGFGSFQKVNTLMRKLKLVLKSYLARLVFSLRFYTWRKRHRISAMKS